MKFTHSWLLDHLDTKLLPQAIGDKLTMAGLELEKLSHLAEGLDKVQVGLIEQIAPHPNADRLTLCQVRVENGVLAIVCGATNHKSGDKVAVARVGARLPNGLEIKKGKIRGEWSEGMLCSLTELGEANTTEGILILPPDTPIGAPIADVLGRNDSLYELNLTPNRGDCLGVRGVARELAALTHTQLRHLKPVVTETDLTHAEIVIEDGRGCPRYAGRIIRGVQIRPSPKWLVRKLASVGIRSINNVVDITNFILIDLNHPMHAFDLSRIKPPLVVRSARSGESLTTLDGEIRHLTDSMLIIADQTQPLALAGIMGGKDSGVSLDTTDLFLEVAYFDPARVTRTGRQLDIRSESRHRFERGIDPLGLNAAMDRATEFILATAGGDAGPITLVDAHTWQPPAPIPLRPDRINKVGGINLAVAEMEAMLLSLGCHKTNNQDQTLYQPPSHRHDLRSEEDLMEEIIRLYGYDRVASRLPQVAVVDPKLFEHQADSIRRVMTGVGYLETINYAFISKNLHEIFSPGVSPTELLNPISAEQAIMRTTLAAGLLETSRRNLSRGNLRLRLFEIGHVFLAEANTTIVEKERLSALISGPLTERNWHSPLRSVDFFDLKGDLEALTAGVGAVVITLRPGGPPFLHPSRKALLFTDTSAPAIGWIGQLHPTIQESLDPAQPVFMFELDTGVLIPAPRKAVTTETLMSRFPAVERDFAFLVEQHVSAQDFLETIQDVDPILIQKIFLFDVYKGEHVPPGKKSFALGVVLRAHDRTLNDKEVQEIVNRIIDSVHSKFAAVQR